MGRAPCCDKANVKKGPWAPEEDAKLKAYIEEYGTGGNWIALPQKIGLKRCGKSCRLRWLNYLRPNIKHGGFSDEEDSIICSLYISIGSRWSIIAAQLPGRTDNDIKNYWNTRLKKKLLGRRKDSQARRLSSLNQDGKDGNGMDDNSYPHTLSNSALERMQLHMQLQTLHNPLSFYNNPALWPKLHPMGDRNMQGHYSLNNNTPPSMQQVSNGQTALLREEKFLELPSSSIEQRANNSTKQDEKEDSFKGFTSSENSTGFNNGINSMGAAIMSKSSGAEELNMNFQSVSSLQAELGDILYNKTSGFIATEDQINEFDCFKDMDGAKEGMIWWTNGFETKSSSSSSWDSASALQTGGLFQDCELGYDI
ncbi:hypothetical protein AQUCO_06800041v1 [Aquilegia coerulea]|uniref:Uncharacterized protein n=1 Tax=Aquilegia coerulea TaxID=218851 RepID=A0A2G5CBG4_AQUCA|nr:hypothetical protein AQUCO_06800041v1 [Aquilegia coerulea]